MRPMRGKGRGEICRKDRAGEDGCTFASHPLPGDYTFASTALAAAGNGDVAGGGAAGGVSLRAERAILARRNAPLLALLFLLAAKGVASRMLGRKPLAAKIDGLLKKLSYDGRHRPGGEGETQWPIITNEANELGAASTRWRAWTRSSRRCTATCGAKRRRDVAKTV